MRLIEALQIVNAARDRAETRRYALLSGFQPLHLATFLRAHLQRQTADARVDVVEGRFGDLGGNLRRAAAEPCDGAAVFVEWADLDPRLGLRHAGEWGPAMLPDVLATAADALARLAGDLRALAAVTPTALSLPTLPLPPVAVTPGWQASPFELALRARLALWAAELAEVPRLRVVAEQRLATRSPADARLSAKGDLATGHPYTQPHAEALAELTAALLAPRAPKKGLITDLDDTLWSGILGEVGVDGVAWDLDRHRQAHGLYQQTLAALAGSGVLVAVASKNDLALVQRAFDRPDLRLARDRVFPMLASWNAKSGAVAEVLQAWNVHADSVVFVDDSPLELAEVQARFPEVTCLRFPADDPDAVLALLVQLRDLFGKEAVLAEDALRLDSLRAAAAMREASASGDAGDPEAFLSTLGATVTVRVGRDDDPRAFELINKTNQFNLNGLRYTEAEWRDLLQREDGFVATVDYADKFGRLGTIAVLAGRAGGDAIGVDRWVMSCRAFARRIEHATVRALFEEFGAGRLDLAYRPTERNAPLREFLAEATAIATPPDGPAAVVPLTRAEFDARCPSLYHDIRRVSGAVPIHG